VPPHAYGKSEREHRQTERRQQFDRWLAAHDAEIRRDQAEKDAAIVDGGQFYNDELSSAEKWHNNGRRAASRDIRAQFATPSPEEPTR